MKDVTWIQDLKLRGSWGKSGSLSNVPGTNPYTLFNSTPYNSNYDLNGTSTSSQQGFYNSQLGKAPPPGAEGADQGNGNADQYIDTSKAKYNPY